MSLKKMVKESRKRLKKFNIKEPLMVEYYTYLSSPTRVFLINFLVGVARGFGFVMGATVVVAILVYVISQILVEIPIVGDFFEWLNRFLQDSLQGYSAAGNGGREFGPQ